MPTDVIAIKMPGTTVVSIHGLPVDGTINNVIINPEKCISYKIGCIINGNYQEFCLYDHEFTTCDDIPADINVFDPFAVKIE